MVPADRPNARPLRTDNLLRQIPRQQWRTIRWREGTKGWLKKKWVAVRADRVVAGECKRLGWLIGERPGYRQQGEWKFYCSDFPADTPLEQRVGSVHHRWHIDRFYQDAFLSWDGGIIRAAPGRAFIVMRFS